MTTTSLDKSKIKILLLEGIHPSAVDAFREDGYTEHRIPPEIAARAAADRSRVATPISSASAPPRSLTRDVLRTRARA